MAVSGWAFEGDGCYEMGGFDGRREEEEEEEGGREEGRKVLTDDGISGGFYRAHLIFPPEYPHLPPKMTFQTPVFHPNGTDKTPPGRRGRRRGARR